MRDGLLQPGDVLDPDHFRPFLYGEEAWLRGEKVTSAETVLWSWIDGAMNIRAAGGKTTVLTTAPTRLWHLERRRSAALPARVGVLRMWAPTSVLVERDRRRPRSLGSGMVTAAAADFDRVFNREALSTWFGCSYFERNADAIEWLRYESHG